MKRDFWYHPEAERELDDAVDFYEIESKERANSFFAEVEANVDIICERPLLGSPGEEGTRRRLLQRYPYTLIYRRRGERDPDLRCCSPPAKARILVEASAVIA